MAEAESNIDRMRAGLPHRALDPEILELLAKGAQHCALVNATEGQADATERVRLLREALGAFGKSFLNPPIHWEFGANIYVGDYCLLNWNCVLMDGAEIRIGDGTLIAPNCTLTTATHPVNADERTLHDPETGAIVDGIVSYAPISIGSRCWLGAGTIVLPGVTIGDGTTVGAGSVVTKSLPPRVLAIGSPARVVRDLPAGGT